MPSTTSPHLAPAARDGRHIWLFCLLHSWGVPCSLPAWPSPYVSPRPGCSRAAPTHAPTLSPTDYEHDDDDDSYLEPDSPESWKPEGRWPAGGPRALWDREQWLGPGQWSGWPWA